MKLQHVIFAAVLAVALPSLFNNCSNVRFDKNSGNSAAEGDANAGKQGAGGSGTAFPGDGTGSIDPNQQVNQPGGGGATPGTTIGDPNNGGIIVGGGPAGSDVSNAGGTGSTPTTAAPAGTVVPKVKFIGPPCIRLTNCAITFELDKAYSEKVEFNWTTDDSLFGQPHTPMWGRAGYAYVPTSGHVVFSPGGSLTQTVHVRNINPDNVEIAIGVRMSTCTYKNEIVSCQTVFSP